MDTNKLVFEQFGPDIGNGRRQYDIRVEAHSLATFPETDVLKGLYEYSSIGAPGSELIVVRRNGVAMIVEMPARLQDYQVQAFVRAVERETYFTG
ncbi:MAG: hypothetical protein V4681_01475 [Patescibacteria group bacterium]